MLLGQLLEETHPRRVQPVAHGQRVHALRRREAEREAEPVAASDPFGDHVRRIALENSEMLLQHLTERPVCYPVTVREAPAGPQKRRPRLPAQPLPELAQEPRLADPGIADDSDQVRFAAADDAAICVLQVRQFAAAPDEDRLQPADPARAHQRQRAHKLAADDALGLSLRLDLHRLGELERAARGRNRPVAGQDLPRRGRLLQSGADVDRVAGDKRAALTGPPHHDVAGIHTDTKGEPPAEQLSQSPLHPQRHMQGPLRVVLMRRRSAENGHHRIADELLDRASSPLDFRRHRVVEAIEHRPDPFGILIGGKLSRPDEVREKNRRKLPFLSPHHPILARHPPTCQLITRQIGPAVKPSGYMSLAGAIRP